MKLETVCPKCKTQRKVVEESISTILKGTTLRFSCGHVLFKQFKTEQAPKARDSVWNKLYPFQKDGVEFIESSKYRCLIGDEMGLGKTVQALAAIRYNRDETLPCLYIVRSNVKYQWQIQILEWCKLDNEPLANIVQVIERGTDTILPITNHLIISMDMLGKFYEQILAWKPKMLIVDESQNFKTPTSGRTESLLKLVQYGNINKILCLSGTPILNRASEFFTTLNLIAPIDWPSRNGFIYRWCGENRAGSNYGGIFPWKREEFFNKINNYVIRREKREVMKDLPEFRRNYEWVKIEDEAIRKAYNSQLKQLDKALNQIEALKKSAFESNSTILGYLTKLRQIAALSKIPWIVEYADSFLTLEEGKKLIVGIHHEIISDTLLRAMSHRKPVLISGKDNSKTKHEKKEKFVNDPSCRLLIGSVLAMGEGLDGLQLSCSDMLLVERQWNLAKEKQFEARLDRHGQKEPATSTLLLAKGTVDEYFTEMVIEKEGYVLSAVKKGEIEGELEKMASSLNYKELAEKCVKNVV